MLLTWPSALSAQPGVDAPVSDGAVLAVAGEAPPEAERFFEMGAQHYEEGDYQAAADDLERALLLDPSSPVLAYNLGRVYELLGNLEESIRHYQRYLRLTDDPTEQERTRRALARLEGAQSRERPAAEASAMPELEDAWPSRTPFWVTLAAGGAIGAAGVALGFVAMTRDAQTRDFVVGATGTLSEREAFVLQADRLALAADLLMGLGFVSALTAVGFLLFASFQSEEDVTEVAIVPTAGGLELQLREAF